jgi:hypothetical protein
VLDLLFLINLLSLGRKGSLLMGWGEALVILTPEAPERSRLNVYDIRDFQKVLSVATGEECEN